MRNEPIVWDSELPYQPSQVQELRHPLPSAPASVHLFYQLHAYDKRQRGEQEHKQRLQQLSILAVVATVLVGIWIVLLRRRERQRELTQQQVDLAERKFLEEGRRHEETERKLLEQRFATQAAEQNTLELKSQLYASIGIMAGSYAHNIKNLLVRPTICCVAVWRRTPYRPISKACCMKFKRRSAPSPNAFSRYCARCAATQSQRAHRPGPQRRTAQPGKDLAQARARSL